MSCRQFGAFSRLQNEENVESGLKMTDMSEKMLPTVFMLLTELSNRGPDKVSPNVKFLRIFYSNKVSSIIFSNEVSSISFVRTKCLQFFFLTKFFFEFFSILFWLENNILSPQFRYHVCSDKLFMRYKVCNVHT
jgi:hypothetical protein